MNWPSIIAGIQGRGLSQSLIAALCGCGQATIADLARGATSEPRFKLGTALLGLSNASDSDLQRLVEGLQKEGQAAHA